MVKPVPSMPRKGRIPRKVYLGRHLMVKGEYVKAILQKEKITTIRWGIVVPKYREIVIHGGGKVIGKALIESVEYKRVKDLTPRDAVDDGFSSKDELLKELSKMYPRIRRNDYITIIRFRLIERFEEGDEAAMYMGFEPVDIARIALRYKIPLSHKEREILQLVCDTGSIRRAAQELGGLDKRRFIRRAIRKALKLLVKRGIIPTRKSSLDKNESSMNMEDTKV